MKSKLFKRSLSTSLVLGVFLLCQGLPGGDWKQFRGEFHNGFSSEKGLLKKWGPKGLKQIWKTPLGPGFSTTTIYKGKVITMFGDKKADKEYLAVFNASKGKMLWKLEVGKYFPDEFGDGPRSTPTVDGKMVYCISSRGQFVGASLSGKKVWEIDLVKKYGSKVPRWGFCTSPIVYKDKVIIEVGGGKGKAFGAFNKANGKDIWLSQDGAATYNSAVIVKIGGKDNLIFANGMHIYSLTPSGKLNWKFKTGLRNPTAVPLYLGNNRFLISKVGGKTGAVAMEIKGGAKKELWKSRKFKNDWSSSVYHAGYIFGFDNATLRCISADTGEVKWSKRGYGKGSLIIAEGKLIVLSDKGILIQVDASPAAYNETGKFQAINGKSWSEPVIANGRIYLRNLQEMACYNLK